MIMQVRLTTSVTHEMCQINQVLVKSGEFVYNSVMGIYNRGLTSDKQSRFPDKSMLEKSDRCDRMYVHVFVCLLA